MERYRIPLGLVTVAAATLLSVGAQAQSSESAVCGDHTTMTQALGQKYSEQPVSMGLATNGTVIEVFASSTGTFTIVMTDSSGRSCMLAAGENFESLGRQVTDTQISVPEHLRPLQRP